jgi:hypothetical protein
MALQQKFFMLLSWPLYKLLGDYGAAFSAAPIIQNVYLNPPSKPS